ncbi:MULTISPECIES: hypothetical protein [unclassified Paenibacillus]|uniref:hypothetical protein n=1 Tax=unclassified Paenibacillus TaxID=185978 RepID=UPI00070E84E1|nr:MULTISPECIES: hypothetical protein [unclassified Paenibacillus]KQX67243.1 hypothetical protein ASD40_26455 [Paenibacillus sp. Root444D2]KRE49991.1 hypothetical protein ASG85_21295 [Paenibacillus sp. Soil724D2]
MEIENRSLYQAEFQALGFSFISNEIVKGRIPKEGDIEGNYIQVEIHLLDFPIKQPPIKVLSINGKSNLYKDMPRSWRHIDEKVLSTNPKESEFYICSLHNWSAKTKFGVQFIYDRILDWFISNVNNEWSKDDDLLSWRILPQFSNSYLYLSQEFIQGFKEIEVTKLYEVSFVHSTYLLANGITATSKKKGTDYDYKVIRFPSYFEEPYYFFEKESRHLLTTNIKNNFIDDKSLDSNFTVIRLPSHFKFKTTYQLLQTLVLNTDIKKILPKHRNVPVIVMYLGDRGRTEYISFITCLEFIADTEITKISLLNIEIIPESPLGIDSRIGLLGVGSLGSQVSKMLAHKKTKSLVISDFDILSIANIGNHELEPFFLGTNKALSMKKYLNYKFAQRVIPVLTDNEILDLCDILVVTVGRKQSFDLLAFKELLVYKKPIIWAWSSPNNILQEIIVTTPNTGCLNCYYKLIEEDLGLIQFHKQAENEIAQYPSETIDLCGNPHTISMWEKMSFLAGQIVTLISYFSKHKKFKYDYYNYYWGMDEIMPIHSFGYLDQNNNCFCKGERV